MVGEAVAEKPVGLEAAVEATTSEQETTPEVATTPVKATSEQPSPELVAAQRRIAQLESQLGTARRPAQQDALLARIVATQQAIADYVDNPDAQPGSLKARMASITDETAIAVANKQTRDEWFSEIGKALADAGMAGNEPELAEASAMWAQGDMDGKEDIKLLHKSYALANAVIRKHLLEQRDEAKTAGDRKAAELALKADEERRRANAASGTLNAGVGSGTPSAGAGATKDNIDGLYMKWEREHPDGANPYEAQYRRLVRTGEI